MLRWNGDRGAIQGGGNTALATLAYGVGFEPVGSELGDMNILKVASAGGRKGRR
jgi:hypothetical protein